MPRNRQLNVYFLGLLSGLIDFNLSGFQDHSNATNIPKTIAYKLGINQKIARHGAYSIKQNTKLISSMTLMIPKMIIMDLANGVVFMLTFSVHILFFLAVEPFISCFYLYFTTSLRFFFFVRSGFFFFLFLLSYLIFKLSTILT